MAKFLQDEWMNNKLFKDNGNAGDVIWGNPYCVFRGRDNRMAYILTGNNYAFIGVGGRVLISRANIYAELFSDSSMERT